MHSNVEKPVFATITTKLPALKVGCQYMMLASDKPESSGGMFYEIFSARITEEQYDVMCRGAAILGMESFVVDCIFNESDTVIVSNPFVPEGQREIIYHLDEIGNGWPLSSQNS